MTKQHFEEFAREIREAKLLAGEKVALAQVVAKVAQRFNPRFDAKRFYKAAGVLGD